MIDASLGWFGDRRLEKGGPFFWAVWSPLAVMVFGSGVWAAIARVRFG